MTQQYLVRAEWDSEVLVWVASSDDVPGLVTEADTIEALEDFLEGFQGCIVAVSHDRAFLDRIARFLIVMDGSGKALPFNGSYLEWRAELETRKTTREAMELAESGADFGKSAAQAGSGSRTKIKRLSFAERKEFEAILPELDTLGKEKADLEALFARKGVASDDLRRAHAHYIEVDSLIGEKTLRWEELALKDSES